MSVTVATANWNGFWGKYGDRWTECVKSMSPAPDRVIVASDEPINTDFDVVICETKSLGPMRNAAIEITDTDWFVPADLDDLPYSNYVSNLNQDFEIHAFCLSLDKSEYGYRPNEWENAFGFYSQNPLVSCSAFKTKWGKKVKYRDIGWEDWAFWLDMKKAGARVYFDKTIRYTHTRLPDGLSSQDVSRKTSEIRKMKADGVWKCVSE